MQNKEALEEAAVFASYGKQVLDNPAYQQAFTARKAKLFDTFCRSKAEETEKREEAWREMQNLIAIERYFNRILGTGKKAEEALNR